MTDITARKVLHSVGPEPEQELITFLCRYPKFVHSEHMRHRTGSYCVSSSRAIPVVKNLDEVRDDALRASPVFWGAEQKGMQAGTELDDIPVPDPIVTADGGLITSREYAKRAWKWAGLMAIVGAEQLRLIGAHKSIVNRVLEPYLHVNVLVTSAAPGLLNFFGLRLDRAAQAEIRALAEAMWTAWNEGEAQHLEHGEWHLPFIDNEERHGGDAMIKVSAARCARLSYLSHETGRLSTIDEDLALYDRLLVAVPVHASPAEHQATPDKRAWYTTRFSGTKQRYFDDRVNWENPHLHGNLPGWIQARKLLPSEAVASLPEGYAR